MDAFLTNASRMYVQYGCGMSPGAGWRNFDASPTLRFERIPLLGRLYTRNSQRFPRNVEYGDIIRGLPVPDESCDGVYCSHVLEHLALADCRKALRNTRRILKHDGTFRLVLPDLEQLATAYLNRGDSHWFMVTAHMGEAERPRGIAGLAKLWLGNARHLWMWDFASMRRELEAAGFRDVRRARFGDSSDPMFGRVEAEHRWRDCLGMECAK